MKKSSVWILSVLVLMITFGCRSDVEIDQEYVGRWVIDKPHLKISILIYEEGRYDYSFKNETDDFFCQHCKCHMYDGVLYLDGGLAPLYTSNGITAKIIGENLWIEDLCFEREYHPSSL